MTRVLLFGIGNPARGDDGLGPALAEAVEKMGIPDVTVDADYQVTVEDSAAVAEHEIVIFADADAEGPAPYSFRPLEPSSGLGFSSHGLEPSQALGLAEECFGRRPRAFMLGIRGYDFPHLTEGLTEEAARNLDAAVRFIGRVLRDGAYEHDNPE